MSLSSSYIAIIADLGHYSARIRLESFARESHALGWRLQFFEQPGVAPRIANDPQSAGLFICNIEPVTGLHASLRETRKPVVEASRKQDAPWPQVFIDEEALARLAIAHFRLLQRRHYAFCGRAGALGAEERATAFARQVETPRETLHRRDIPVENAEAAGHELDRLLLDLPLPACLLAYEDRIAERALERCAELGLSVPGDLAVLSCGDDPLLSSLGSSALSSIVFPSEEIGRTAAKILHDLIQGKPADRPIYRIEPLELRIRDSTDPAASADPVLARALDFIRTRAGEPITVDHIARAAGVSRRSLEVRFRGKLQKSVHQQLQEMRMEKARGLIRASNRAMEDIAVECGFSSAATFSRAFRAWFGHPPSLLRGAR